MCFRICTLQIHASDIDMTSKLMQEVTLQSRLPQYYYRRRRLQPTVLEAKLQRENLLPGQRLKVKSMLQKRGVHADGDVSFKLDKPNRLFSPTRFEQTTMLKVGPRSVTAWLSRRVDIYKTRQPVLSAPTEAARQVLISSARQPALRMNRATLRWIYSSPFIRIVWQLIFYADIFLSLDRQLHGGGRGA